MKRPFLLAAGGAHIDRRGTMDGAYVPAASNPGRMREEVGGGAFNALRNARRHGVDGALLSLRGGDSGADRVAQAIAAAGIDDLSAVFLDRATPSYTALIDSGGELVAGFADMALYDLAFARQLRRHPFRRAAARADALLCDANMTSAALRKLVELAESRPVFAIGVSPAKVTRLEPVLPGLACLFMNQREARVLAGCDEDAPDRIARHLAGRGLRRGAITCGAAAVLGFDEAGAFKIDPPAAACIGDVTGAGDALAGVTSAGMMHGMGLRAALRHGMAAAMLTVESETVVADYSDARFDAALARVGEPRSL